MGQRPDARLTVRFGDEVLQRGHTAVPNLVMDYYARLGISPAEMLFTIHVWQHWWTARDPHPSLRTIAHKMSLSVRQAKRYVEALERKGFLNVVERFAPHGGQLTNEFDYSPLIRAVVRAARADGALSARSPAVARRLRRRRGDAIFDTPPEDGILHSPDDTYVTGARGGADAPGRASPSPEEECIDKDTSRDPDMKAPSTHDIDTPSIHNGPARAGLTVQQLWAATLSTLAARVPPAEVEAWLRPARIAAWREGLVVVAAPSTVAGRRIVRRYGGLLRATLAALAGEPLALACVSEAAWRTEGLAAARATGDGDAD